MADGQGQQQVIIAVSPKSVGIAIILTIVFGPLGMFYSTIIGAIVMLVVTLIAVVITFGLGLLITWPVCIIWGALAANAHNKKLMSGLVLPQSAQ